jgi:hypothetical protein
MQAVNGYYSHSNWSGRSLLSRLHGDIGYMQYAFYCFHTIYVNGKYTKQQHISGFGLRFMTVNGRYIKVLPHWFC